MSDLKGSDIGQYAAQAVKNAVAQNPLLFTTDLIARVTKQPQQTVCDWLWGYKNEAA